MAGQEVRQAERGDLEGGFERRFPRMFPSIGTGRRSCVQVVRGSGFNLRSAETGQPGAFVRAPPRKDYFPRLHEIYSPPQLTGSKEHSNQQKIADINTEYMIQ